MVKGFSNKLFGIKECGGVVMGHEIEIMELKEQVQKLTEERDVLIDQLAKVGALGDTKKEELLRKVIKAHPDCYNWTEFDDAFHEAAKQ